MHYKGITFNEESTVVENYCNESRYFAIYVDNTVDILDSTLYFWIEYEASVNNKIGGPKHGYVLPVKVYLDVPFKSFFDFDYEEENLGESKTYPVFVFCVR